MGQAVNTYLASRIQSRVGNHVSRKTRRRRITDALIVMTILAFAGVCFSLYLRSGEELNAAKSKRQALSDRVESLKIETDRLEREVKALQSDPKAIEAYARHELGFIRPEDVVLKVEPNPAKHTAQ